MIARQLLPADPEEIARAIEGIVARNRLQIERAERAGQPLPSVYAAGVVWRLQELRTDYWQSIRDVLADGWGDCKAFTAWRLAELQHQGYLWALPHVIWTGPHQMHALIKHLDGTWEDPSRRLAM